MMTNESQGENANGRIILLTVNVKIIIFPSIPYTLYIAVPPGVWSSYRQSYEDCFSFCTAICCVYNVDLHLPFSPFFQLQIRFCKP